DTAAARRRSPRVALAVDDGDPRPGRGAPPRRAARPRPRSPRRSAEGHAHALTDPVDACLCPAYDEWVVEAEGIRAVCLYGRHAGKIGAIARSDLLVATDEEGGDVTRLHYRDGSPAPGNLALGVVDDGELTRRVASGIAGEL